MSRWRAAEKSSKRIHNGESQMCIHTASPPSSAPMCAPYIQRLSLSLSLLALRACPDGESQRRDVRPNAHAHRRSLVARVPTHVCWDADTRQEGDGVTQDTKEAVRPFTLAAVQGLAQAHGSSSVQSHDGVHKTRGSCLRVLDVLRTHVSLFACPDGEPAEKNSQW